MNRFLSAVILLSLPLLAAAQPTTAPATSPAKLTGREIRDEAHFFSTDALARANERIEAIHRRFDKDVVIETYPAIPDDRKQRFAQVPRAEFFDGWLKDRARDRKVDGVFILICRNPGHTEVRPGSLTAEKVFTAENGRELNDVILAAFRNHDYDAGLISGLDLVELRMERTTGKH